MILIRSVSPGRSADPDRLEVRDPVKVEIVGEDCGPASPGEDDKLGVDVADFGRIVADDLNRGGPVLLEPGQDFQATAAAGPALRVRAVGYPLELVEHEVRDEQPVVEKARVDYVCDSAVDDGARVHDHFRLAAGRLVLSVDSPQDPRGFRSRDQVLAFGDRQAEHPQAEADRDADGQVVTEGVRKEGQREPQQEGDKEADQQTDDGGDELGSRHRLDSADQPTGGHDCQVRQKEEADRNPGGRPDWYEQARGARLLERRVFGEHECQTNQGTHGRPDQANYADHDATPSDEAGELG
jgi:hypothetical protein